jgi:hypothetical protein
MKRHLCVLLIAIVGTSWADDGRQTAAYRRVKASLDAVAAIDTHDHLFPFEKNPAFVETDRGRGVNLAGLWQASYYRWVHPLTPWRAGGSFDEWWAKAKHDFANARATSFYRYQLAAFKDLYGVDFDAITDAQARKVNERIFQNYRDQRWLYHVITERANIELMLNDPHWASLEFKTDYRFGVLVFRVNSLFRGFHPSEFKKPEDDPYRIAREEKLAVNSLDDYLKLVDRIFQRAKAAARCV